ncbi:RNA polymerase II subunit 5-mediating protein homolog [Papaver somniferum]|uniref:RNA polymerase II subunit 5-mediating protein homolog n=1 Tax=Papaver somniferum TaxID=3469 RepID=UPI000E6F562C|nr:RNA polymerase II subunit 5-mediating protein homolog [Papaver somniferum]
MEQRGKGTVTSLASLISVEEAQKAVKTVEGSIAEHQKELDHICHFISENNNLIHLVYKLPDELHHAIMVPFGKAAFFPGRLVHTDEFIVLLGEEYYVQRTSKQTVGVLQRRGEVLDSQVESLKAMMLDTAEAAEDTSNSSKVQNVEVAGEDEEYARIVSRLNGLEQEELEAEDEDTNFGCWIDEHSFEQLKISEGRQHGKSSLKKNSRNLSQSQQNSAEWLTVENLIMQQHPEDNYLNRESLPRRRTSNLQSHCNLKRRKLKK